MFLKVQGKASHAGRCYADGASAILEIAHKTLAIDTFWIWSVGSPSTRA